MLVALTREAGSNGSLRALLDEAGVQTCAVPCIRFGSAVDQPRLAPKLQAGGWAYVVLTSPHAAAVFCAEWLHAGAPDVPVASIGKGTTDALLGACAAAVPAAAPPRVVFQAEKASAAAMSEELPFCCHCGSGGGRAGSGGGRAGSGGGHAGSGGGGGGGSGGGCYGDGSGGGCDSEGSGAAAAEGCLPPRVLYPASRAAGHTLQEGLAARGFDVQRLDVYDTVAATWGGDEAAAAAAVHAAAFASPSAAKGWVLQGGGTETVAAVCIGETTAAAARALGFKRVLVAAQPKMPALAEAVVRALSGNTNVERGVSAVCPDGVSG